MDEFRKSNPQSHWGIIVVGGLICLILFVIAVQRVIEDERSALQEQGVRLAGYLDVRLHQSSEVAIDTWLLHRKVESSEAESEAFHKAHLQGRPYLQAILHLLPSDWKRADFHPYGAADNMPMLALEHRYMVNGLESLPGLEVLNDSLLAAIDDGQEHYSEEVELASGDKGFYLVHPFYNEINGEGVEGRRASLGSVVVLLVRPQELLHGVEHEQTDDQLYVGGRLLAEWRHAANVDGGRFLPHLAVSQYFSVGPREYHLTVEKPLYWGGLNLKLPVLAVILGLLISGLLFALKRSYNARAMMLQGRNREIQRQVARQTEELRRSKVELERQRFAVDQHAIVSITDAAGNITHVNEKFCQISGYSADELLGQNHRLLKSGQQPDSVFEEMWRAISRGQVWNGVICNRKKNGGLYWVRSTIVPFLDENGLPYQYVSIRTDISENRQVEEALERAEERYRRSQAFANIGTWDWDIQSGELHWSERIAPLFGYEVGALETTYENFINALHPDDREQVSAAVTACIEEGAEYDIEHRVVWPDGQVRWLSEKGDVVRDENGRPLHMLGVVQDIHDRKMAEAARVESEARLKEAQRMARIGHWTLDMASGQLYWSDEIYRIFGRQPGEFEPSYERFFEMVHPDDVAAVKASEKAAEESGIHRVDHRILLADGSVRWVHEEAHTEHDDKGEKMRLIGTVQDITERKQAEEEAIRANRAKSEFLSSMSHELRTPMNAILGFAQLLEGEENLTGEQRENIHDIVKAGNHLLALINEVLDLSRIEAGKMELSIESVALDEVIGAVSKLITPLAEKRTIRLQHDAECISDQYVHADHIRTKQILLNLLSNAVKYNRDGGEVFIHCREGSEGRLRIEVRDTGPGIAAEKLDKLFEAFNRLDADSAIEGTGIGLVITRQLVELMGGEMGVESEMGVGTTFWFELPRIEGKASATESSSEGEALVTAAPTGERTILYIEDNPVNLKLVTQLIAKKTAHRLFTADEPQRGLELAAEKRPDLILLDINLPGMSGYEVVEQLRKDEETRSIPVVALSANAMADDVARGREAGFDDYLTKPLNIQEFFAMLSRYLEGGE